MFHSCCQIASWHLISGLIYILPYLSTWVGLLPRIGSFIFSLATQHDATQIPAGSSSVNATPSIEYLPQYSIVSATVDYHHSPSRCRIDAKHWKLAMRGLPWFDMVESLIFPKVLISRSNKIHDSTVEKGYRRPGSSNEHRAGKRIRDHTWELCFRNYSICCVFWYNSASIPCLWRNMDEASDERPPVFRETRTERVNDSRTHMYNISLHFVTSSRKRTISSIPLRRDPLRVDVAGLQGIQWVGPIQQCASWSLSAGTSMCCDRWRDSVHLAWPHIRFRVTN